MHLEQLEGRLLLSSATLKKDLLTVTGSPGRDRIRVVFWHLGSGPTVDVRINGRRQRLRGTEPGEFISPQKVRIFAGAGDDAINLYTPVGAFPTTVDGGSGDDRINVHARGATILGGEGNDEISIDSYDLDPSGAVFGGNGNDLIIGSDYPNHLWGGSGDDTLFGKGGDDTLVGGRGRDVLKHELLE